jgi:polyhydroxybutyrate depolymerase
MAPLRIIQRLAAIALLVCCQLAKACAQENTVAPKSYYTSNFVIDGIPRNVSFYIPAGYGKNDTYPVLFVLHADNENGRALIKKYGSDFEKLADSAACVVVYPDAVKGHWNTKMSAQAAGDTINDAGFINIMIDYFMQQYKGDPGRIFVTGFYNGGQMAWRMACTAAKKVVAIAPFIPSIAEAQKTCPVNNIPVFNPGQYMPGAGGKLSHAAIKAAFNFLLNHPAY